MNDFYDQLTPYYHLIYPDWEQSVQKQAAALGRLLRARWGIAEGSVLDASCGIGTQALGLAALGYHVTASDLSRAEIVRAREEARRRGLDIDFSVADMRRAYAHHQREFDAVISCDNSLPHLLTDGDILRALKQFYKCCRPGGGCLISIRDYEKETLTGKIYKPYGIREQAGKLFQISQVWDCHPPTYEVSLYIVEDDGSPDCKTFVTRTTYYAVTIPRLTALMEQAGFSRVSRIDDTFFQPVILGDK